ncbi:DUF397 domain-containing protein [Streptomyces sp. CB01881]|uniref:DUF397 domain-containing protein n=1 Tax=Streptomyces sp. CB01881 TaxID=2078691 RepID=UPI000CDBEDCC|nr:DUF397 domain-containing protein [Streptomyces sp. CB01881]AUY47855.1 DUF397 domain-containing protein [Streptomyces sp. CB01881]TYC76330.1 DUF397 domain-containing protein [Streptomyces sp. CB01881]
MRRIELATPFKKSSYSQQGGECVEVASLQGGGRAVRDSKDVDGPTLQFRPEAWQAFISSLHIREFPMD